MLARAFGYQFMRFFCLSAIILTAWHAVLAKPLTGAEAKAMFIKMPRPDYPYEARKQHLEGRGLFRLSVDEQGTVTSVTTLKGTGHRELDRSCLKAFRKWQAKAGARGIVEVPVAFTMKASFPDFYLDARTGQRVDISPGTTHSRAR